MAPTLKQKRAFKAMVENGGNVSKAMISAGYSAPTAKTPQKLTESDGFQEILRKSGLTEELISTSLVEDIKKKKQNRVAELRLGSEILGMKKVDGNDGDTNIQINLINYGDNTVIPFDK